MHIWIIQVQGEGFQKIRDTVIHAQDFRYGEGQAGNFRYEMHVLHRGSGAWRCGQIKV